VSLLYDGQSNLFFEDVHVEVPGRAAADQAVAQVNNLGIFFLEPQGSFEYLIGLVSSATATGIKSN